MTSDFIYIYVCFWEKIYLQIIERNNFFAY